MRAHYDYSRKRGDGYHAVKRREKLQIFLLLLIGGSILGFLIYLLLTR